MFDFNLRHSDEKLRYDACVLQMLRDLLLQGFFSPQGDSAQQTQPGLSDVAGFFFGKKQGGEEVFSNDVIEPLLVDKLCQFVDRLADHPSLDKVNSF